MNDRPRSLLDSEPGPERDRVEAQLHALDHEINQVRQRIIFLKRGALESDDPGLEIADLERRYLELGERFTGLYRSWQQLS